MERAGFLGGSDIGNILKVDDYSCPLRTALGYRGIKPENAPPESKAIQRGKRLEDFVARLWAEERNRKITRWKQQPHPKYPWARVQVDRRVVNDPRGPGYLEVKIPGRYRWQQYKREGLSEQYILQLHWGLFVTGGKWGSWAIFNADIYEFADENRAEFTVNYDADLMKQVFPIVEEFQARCEFGPLPEKLDRDSKACSSCAFRMNCHGVEATQEIEGDKVECNDSELFELANKYSQLKAIEKDLEAEQEAVMEGFRKYRAANGKTFGNWGSLVQAPPTKRFSMDLVAKKYPRIAKALQTRDEFKKPDEKPFFRLYPKKEN